ncbi:hypothetical protein AMJ80_11530 [bacterium SM23_31]|nr:MAG: hypothetical protein AMJ80_11530 [bacterium SM23_31]
MRSFFIFALLLVFIFCSENKFEIERAGESTLNIHGLPTLPEMVTLECSIGGEDFSDLRFILAAPMEAKITMHGDILIFDEFSIKVLDEYGNPKKIMGGRGEGPGEFLKPPTIMISPFDYFTVIEPASMNTFFYTIYDRENTFLNEFRFRCSSQLENFLISKDLSWDDFHSAQWLMAPDSASLMYSITLCKEGPVYYKLIAYEDNLRVYPIYFGTNKQHFVYKNRSTVSSFFNEYRTFFLPNNRVLFYDSSENTFESENKGTVTFHIISLPAMQRKTYTVHVESRPRNNIDDFVDYSSRSRLRIRGEIDREYYEQMRKYLNTYRHSYVLTYILPDYAYQYLLFFTAKRDDEGNRYVKVFDIEQEKFISDFYWPFGGAPPDWINDGSVIINAVDSTGFPVVRKYKLNPSVYENMK